MPYIWVRTDFSRRGEQISLNALWKNVARIRAASGDKEGAEQARANARVTARFRQRYGPHFLTFQPVTVHFAADGPAPACNYAAPVSQLSEDVSLVDCGNCTRTRAYRAAKAAG